MLAATLESYELDNVEWTHDPDDVPMVRGNYAAVLLELGEVAEAERPQPVERRLSRTAAEAALPIAASGRPQAGCHLYLSRIRTENCW